MTGSLPLGKALIASDMSSLARPAPVPGFGVALTRRTTSRTDHCCFGGSVVCGGVGGVEI